MTMNKVHVFSDYEKELQGKAEICFPISRFGHKVNFSIFFYLKKWIFQYFAKNVKNEKTVGVKYTQNASKNIKNM